MPLRNWKHLLHKTNNLQVRPVGSSCFYFHVLVLFLVFKRQDDTTLFLASHAKEWQVQKPKFWAPFYFFPAHNQSLRMRKTQSMTVKPNGALVVWIVPDLCKTNKVKVVAGCNPLSSGTRILKCPDKKSFLHFWNWSFISSAL